MLHRDFYCRNAINYTQTHCTDYIGRLQHSIIIMLLITDVMFPCQLWHESNLTTIHYGMPSETT